MSDEATEPTHKPVEHFRLDYKPNPYTVPNLDLNFELDESDTIVHGVLHLNKAFEISEGTKDIVLDGEELELLELILNETKLSADQYSVADDQLTISAAVIDSIVSADKKNFQLSIKVKVHPDKNTALSGLYKSADLLCTQCEAMGFRRIIYYFDRPDVLTVYSVRLEGDKTRHPVLLSNGNRISAGDISGTNRHWALWQDPFPKPCYLFALVAGDLASIHDTYKTTSGRVVQLGIYAEKENKDQLDHAMYSLKASMKWDEDTFGLECDLDVYNVVSTNFFNMGAM